MKEIKIGVIGCGLFGKTIIEAWSGVPFAKVEAICDIDAKVLNEASKQYKIKKAFTDFKDLCKLPELDAVCVVTTENRHRAPTVAALANGKHVFCEKPIATTVADAEAMAWKAEETGLNLMIGHILRFETRYAMAKDEIQAGKIGAIASISARRNRVKELYRLYQRQPLFLENCIHDIDMMLWYTGDTVAKVRGFDRKVLKGKNPNMCWGFLEFKKGAVGTVETIWMIPEQSGVILDDNMQVIGSKGILNLDIAPVGLSLWGSRGYQGYDIGYDSRFRGQANGAMLAELVYFADCVANGKKVTINKPREGLEALKVALALVKSARTGKDVKV